MFHWKDVLRGDPLPWLLEADSDQPGVRYFALRDLLDRPESDGEVVDARKAVMKTGPVPAMLAAQAPEGYWAKPGPGYGPKYKGTIWQVIFLAQLGADGSDDRVKAACDYTLQHNRTVRGVISVNKTSAGFIHCMAGNLGWALFELGQGDDARLHRALDYQARMITGLGIASAEEKDAPDRYHKSATCGPMFRCSPNMGEPCVWGAVKEMLAMGMVPAPKRSPVIDAAISTGTDFLLSRDPAVADYPHPMAKKPSESWFKFGYPIGYVTDVLQILEALVLLRRATDPRLANALRLVLSKQDELGRWKLEYTYNGKTWADVEKKGKPSKWVTLRALRVLKAAYPA